jgi:hypothetical protein
VGIGARETTMAMTGMSFAMTQEWRSPLLRPRLVRSDIFVHELTPNEVEMIREALGKGLTPNGFEVTGNAVILRFDRNESPTPTLVPMEAHGKK